MARYTESVCRLCRREGQKLFLKGERCYTDKCAVAKREYAPGQHGKARKKLSEYGIQLREKQKTKRYYGVSEKQFRKYFVLATKKQGITGENLLQILETRLDNVVYRMGYGTSRAQARQFVNHGHFLVNGKRVDIASFLVKVGDVVELKDNSKSMKVLKENAEVSSAKAIPQWLSMQSEKMAATVITLPKREDVDIAVAEHLIVELYSK